MVSIRTDIKLKELERNYLIFKKLDTELLGRILNLELTTYCLNGLMFVFLIYIHIVYNKTYLHISKSEKNGFGNTNKAINCTPILVR